PGLLGGPDSAVNRAHHRELRDRRGRVVSWGGARQGGAGRAGGGGPRPRRARGKHGGPGWERRAGTERRRQKPEGRRVGPGAPKLSEGAAGASRAPIIADTGVLGVASDGNARALSLIRGGTAYAPPGVISEFLNISQRAERFAFLQREGIKMLSGPMDPNVYRAISPLHGQVDAELASLASGTGYTAYTTNRRLVNLIQQTLRLNVPVQMFVP